MKLDRFVWRCQICGAARSWRHAHCKACGTARGGAPPFPRPADLQAEVDGDA